jgi:hypothetical protein
MNKRLRIGLAPVLIISAVAALPATTQAAPHVYENAVKKAEGQKLRYLGWGTLKLKNATLGAFECHHIFAGYLENPAGGSAAEGKTQAFVPYECVSTACTVFNAKGIAISAETMPWDAEVIEPEAGVFRQKTGFKATEKNKPPKEPGFVELTLNCEGVFETKFFGETNPKILDDGLSIGSFPGEEEFTPGAAGESELESEGLGNWEWEGKVKFAGYANLALIEVKNP